MIAIDYKNNKYLADLRNILFNSVKKQIEEYE